MKTKGIVYQTNSTFFKQHIKIPQCDNVLRQYYDTTNSTTYLPKEENQNSCKCDAGFGSELLLILEWISACVRVSKYFNLRPTSPVKKKIKFTICQGI